MYVDAMTRKGKRKLEHRQKDGWSTHGKPVNSVETDTAEPQDVDHPSEQTCASCGGLAG